MGFSNFASQAYSDTNRQNQAASAGGPVAAQEMARGAAGYAVPSSSQNMPQFNPSAPGMQPRQPSPTPGYAPNPYFSNPQASQGLAGGAYGRNLYSPDVKSQAGTGSLPQTFGTYGGVQIPPGAMRGVAEVNPSQRQLPAGTAYSAAPAQRMPAPPRRTR
jgi:hypothetical protein